MEAKTKIQIVILLSLLLNPLMSWTQNENAERVKETIRQEIEFLIESGDLSINSEEKNLIIDIFDIVIDEIYLECSDLRADDEKIIMDYWNEIVRLRDRAVYDNIKYSLIGTAAGAGCILLIWFFNNLT